MTDKLAVYNAALFCLGKHDLPSLTVQMPERRVLDQLWDQELAYCLERKFWNFIYRTVSIDASSTVQPSFGFQFAFRIPDDWIRTRLLSAAEQLEPPLLAVREEAGFWYADVTPIYVQYSSSGALYGMNLGEWPASFADYVAKRLARQACMRITGSADLLQGPQGLIKQETAAYKVAAANCAMNEAVGFAPTTGWVRARRGQVGLGDRPGGSSLIG